MVVEFDGCCHSECMIRPRFLKLAARWVGRIFVLQAFIGHRLGAVIVALFERCGKGERLSTVLDSLSALLVLLIASTGGIWLSLTLTVTEYSTSGT
jgi:hypothetical protein